MENNLRVVLFCSRKKDNKDIDFFKPRSYAFLSNDAEGEEVKDKFNHFCTDGAPNELCRYYISVNRRDPQKVRDNLIMRMLSQHNNFDPTKVNDMLVSVAADIDCALDHNWMFDVDYYEDNLPRPSNDEVREMFAPYVDAQKLQIYDTVNGLAVITPNHFDTRGLLDKYTYITLKRDDMFCFKWGRWKL